MNLANPDTGDILDRLTILQLKLLISEERPAWADESAILYKRIEEWTLKVPYIAWIIRLAAVNAAIWQARDRIKALGQEHVIDIAQLALKLEAWQDQRCLIVKHLNETLGRGEHP